MNDNPTPMTARRWPGRLAVIVAFIWAFAVAYAAQMYSWTAAALGVAGPSATPVDVRVSLLQGLALGLPLLVLARLVRTPRHRAILTAWLLATVMLLALALPRLLPSTQTQLLMPAQTLLLVLVGWLLRRRLSLARQVTELDAVPWALGAAALFVIPWAAGGALGSVLDTLLATLLGLTFGVLSARLLAATWFAVLRDHSRGRRRDVLTGGFVVGMTLVIAASGLSHNGLQLALMVALSAWGWALAGLATIRQPDAPARMWAAAALFLGLTVAAVLVLVDTDGVLLEAMDPILANVWRAVGISVLLGWLAGVGALLWANRLPAWRPTRVVAGIAAALWLPAAVVYFTLGVPGLHGDRLFVMLEEPADLHALVAVDDAAARRDAVYRQLTAHATASQADLRRTLDRFGYTYTPYYLVNVVEVSGGLPTRLWLALRDDVDRVLPSPRLRPVRRPLPFATGLSAAPDGVLWNLTDIGADRVWNELGVTGAGVVVGLSDSGAQWDHPELVDSYRGRDGEHDYNWYDPWLGTVAPVDFDGHGTHTLGSVLGNAVGVAPDAEWFACANLVRNLGNPALYLDCWQFMLAPFPHGGDPFVDGEPARGAHVLNNSWGCPEAEEGCDPDSLHAAAVALRTAGLFTVVSAGNSGPRCHTVDAAPAIYDEVLSVGAVDQAGDLALFSSAGPVTVDGSGRTKPDIVAPGVDILSAYPNGSYELASGTSMAGPHVAGVVALMWSANPALIGDIATTEALLLAASDPFAGSLETDVISAEMGEETGEETGLPGEQLGLFNWGLSGGDSCLFTADLEQTPNNVVGYGAVDAFAAVQQALAARAE